MSIKQPEECKKDLNISKEDINNRKQETSNILTSNSFASIGDGNAELANQNQQKMNKLLANSLCDLGLADFSKQQSLTNLNPSQVRILSVLNIYFEHFSKLKRRTMVISII